MFVIRLKDFSYAKDEHLSIGDTMEEPCKLTEQPLKFTVGAIYNHDSLFAQYEAVILLNEKNNAVLLPVIEEAGYTNAYIKASNLSELSQYFEEEFIPGLICIGVSEVEIAELTREDIEPYYENYESHVKRNELTRLTCNKNHCGAFAVSGLSRLFG